MKKKWLTATTICLYLIQALLVGLVVCFIKFSYSNAGTIFFALMLVVLILVSLGLVLINLLSALNLYRRNLLAQRRTKSESGQNPNKRDEDIEKKIFGTVLRYKLALIPFYVLNFVWWAIITIGFLNPFLIWALPFVLPLAFGYAFMTLVATSAYTIICLLILKDSEKITPRQCAVHILLQLIFIIDVIDIFCLKKITNE